MLFALALIPVIGLLIFIYFNDKKEKEPIWLLLLLFGVGAASVVSAIVLELIGAAILGAFFPTDSVIKGTLDAMLIVAPAEELGKFIVLRSITWKNKHFNYSYDAIVYAVFVSLGFAALENITYSRPCLLWCIYGILLQQGEVCEPYEQKGSMHGIYCSRYTPPDYYPWNLRCHLNGRRIFRRSDPLRFEPHSVDRICNCIVCRFDNICY